MESVAHAVAGRLLADRQGHVDRERAYTAGLLQDIGYLVLDRYYDDARAQVMEIVGLGHPLIEAERVALGMHHPELGARLATRWQLPEVLTDTIRHHHSPDQARIDPKLAAVVHLAEAMAAAQIDALDARARMHEMSDLALEIAELQRSDLESIGQELALELDRARDLFAMA